MTAVTSAPLTSAPVTSTPAVSGGGAGGWSGLPRHGLLRRARPEHADWCGDRNHRLARITLARNRGQSLGRFPIMPFSAVFSKPYSLTAPSQGGPSPSARFFSCTQCSIERLTSNIVARSLHGSGSEHRPLMRFAKRFSPCREL